MAVVDRREVRPEVGLAVQSDRVNAVVVGVALFQKRAVPAALKDQRTNVEEESVLHPPENVPALPEKVVPHQEGAVREVAGPAKVEAKAEARRVKTISSVVISRVRLPTTAI